MWTTHTQSYTLQRYQNTFLLGTPPNTKKAEESSHLLSQEEDLKAAERASLTFDLVTGWKQK